MENVSEMMNSIVPREICELFGVPTMTIDSLFGRINELSNSIEHDENEIIRLKEELSFLLSSDNSLLTNIQNKKYQLTVSRNLLSQIQQEIKKLQFKKHNILEGNYEGQITLKMAQTKGFVYLQFGIQHAIEFLASELRFPLISLSKTTKQKNFEIEKNDSDNFNDFYGYTEPNGGNFQYTRNMKSEISNLFNEVVKYLNGLRSIYNEQISLDSAIRAKISTIQSEVKIKHEERNNAEIELNQLEYELAHMTSEVKKPIRVRPDRFEERAKGRKIIVSKKKEFYRLNRILNEFKNNRFVEHQKKYHKKCKNDQNSFNSFDLEVHCFDENFRFDEELDALTRDARKSVLALAKDLVAEREENRNKAALKERFISENISSLGEIIGEIECSNANLAQMAENPVPESVLK